MKRILLTFCTLLLFAPFSYSQFHMELGLSFNSPTSDFGEPYDVGGGLSFESKYAISDNVDVGLHLSGNGFAGQEIGTTSGKVDATLVVPVLIKGNYLFTDSKVSPYVGFGTGMYFAKIAKFSESALGGSERSEENISEFGFAPSAGVYIGRMNLGLSYHSAGDISFMRFILGVRILDRI